MKEIYNSRIISDTTAFVNIFLIICEWLFLSKKSPCFCRAISSNRTVLKAVVRAPMQPRLNMIVDNLKIRAYLTAVVGPDPSIKKSDKNWLIERALKEQNITDKSGVVMVGDREYDIKGAKDVGIASIGVLYGYGFREELEGAGADHIVETVDDLQKLLLSQ